MAEFKDEQILHLAELSALELNTEEIASIKDELTSILQFAGKVVSVSVESSAESGRKVSLSSLRSDELAEGLSNSQALLNAPKSEGGCFVVSKVVE